VDEAIRVNAQFLDQIAEFPDIFTEDEVAEGSPETGTRSSLARGVWIDP
jgi:hypothetical protein